MRTASRALLDNPHKTHGAVVGGLPGHPSTERPLWRWDTDSTTNKPYLLVLTQTAPDWTHLVEQYGWPHADGEHIRTRDYTPLLDHIDTGREFAFRVTANPVRNAQSRKPASGTDQNTPRTQLSPRTAHRTPAHQLSWFLSRTSRWGFDIPPAPVPASADTPADASMPPAPDVRLLQPRRLSFHKNPRPRQGQGKTKPVVLHVATFEGRMRVTDPDALVRTLLTGLGPAKAYGCGLLTLAPLPGTPVGKE